jgi:hypothetical protein
MARALPLLGLLLLAAALCVAQADAAGVQVQVQVKNKCAQDVRLVLGVVKGKVLEVKAGALAVLGPVEVDVRLGNILKVDLFVRDGRGRLLKVKVTALIDLAVVARLVDGVRVCILEVVENKKGKVLELVALVGGRSIVVAKITVAELLRAGLAVHL